MNNKKSISNINKEKTTDPDFKNEILPAILVKIKEELGANTIDENNQRIEEFRNDKLMNIDY